MTRLANEHSAINLAQGFPDFATPAELKEAAVAAIRGDVNQCPITWGSRDLREAIAASYERRGWPSVDPASEVTVTCGSTDAMAAAFLSLIDPGDKIILLEPRYANYGPHSHPGRATVRTVAVQPPDWRVDPDESCAAVSSRTRAIVIDTQHNPSGKVLASVPRSSFYCLLADGAQYAPFAFPKRRETLEAAGERLVAFGRRLGLA